MFKKNNNKFKAKKSKYVVECTDHEIVLLISIIENAIYDIMTEINYELDNDNEIDKTVIHKLLCDKYILMKISRSFGFSLFNDYLKNDKGIEKELEKLILTHKKSKNEFVNEVDEKIEISSIEIDNNESPL